MEKGSVEGSTGSSFAVRVGREVVCVVFAVAACAWLAGCSTAYYKKSADKEVYSIIDGKSSKVPGMEAGFKLDEDKDGFEQLDLVKAALEGKAPPLTLADAITIATANSRDYLTQRENVYLAALGLTAARFVWKPHLSGALSGFFQNNSGDKSVGGNSNFGVTQALSTGGDVALTLSSNFLRFLTGDPREAAASTIAATLRQPLWRGAGQRVAQEGLTQAERDMIYALRSFARFRDNFNVQIAQDFYGVLQQKDRVENTRLNYENVTKSRERAEMQAEAGRLKDFEVGQAKQSELSAKDDLVQQQQTYETKLDSFKIELGLPVTAQITLDQEELKQLKIEAENQGRRTREEQAQLATLGRLDLLTAFDNLDDADRKIVVAADNLNPDVDLVASGSLSTPPTQPANFDGNIYNYRVGAEVNLPLNRLNERNAYRASLIAKNRTIRNYTLLRDQVRQQVYGDWRTLDQQRVSCEIQQISVELANRQVENTTLSIEAGRATMRDQLDAQAAQLSATLNLTSTLVGYRIAQLSLWRDTGTLTFKDGRFMEDISNVEAVAVNN
jgi:outer membrane protein TolC